MSDSISNHQPANRAGRVSLAVALLGVLGASTALLLPAPQLPEQAAQKIDPQTAQLINTAANALLMVVFVWLGGRAARSVGLRAPWLEAAFAGGARPKRVKQSLGVASALGVAGALWAVLIEAFMTKGLPASFQAAAETYKPPLLARVFYGGLYEEALCRWGLMSIIVWALWRTVARKHDRPTRTVFVLSAAITALLFGLGHLPAAVAMVGAPTPALVSYLLLGNLFVGVAAGLCFWKLGIESAMVCHMVAGAALWAFATLR